MKLSNLFMIALLAGTLGVFGCSDDETNGGGGSTGTAGTGGSGTAGTGGSGGADACTGGQCADADVKTRCEEGVEYCKSLGAGGAGGAPTEEQCDAAGGAFCNIDTGAGGEGGGGGNPGNCDWTVEQVCNVDTCDVDDQVDACKSRYEECLDAPPSGNFCEKCAVIALEKCGGA